MFTESLSCPRHWSREHNTVQGILWVAPLPPRRSWFCPGIHFSSRASPRRSWPHLAPRLALTDPRVIPFPSPTMGSRMRLWLNLGQSAFLETSGKDFPLPCGASRKSPSLPLDSVLRGLELLQSQGWLEEMEEGRAKVCMWRWSWNLQMMAD